MKYNSFLNMRSIYHPLKADIISKINHPFRKERISLKKSTPKRAFFLSLSAHQKCARRLTHFMITAKLRFAQFRHSFTDIIPM